MPEYLSIVTVLLASLGERKGAPIEFIDHQGPLPLFPSFR